MWRALWLVAVAGCSGQPTSSVELPAPDDASTKVVQDSAQAREASATEASPADAATSPYDGGGWACVSRDPGGAGLPSCVCSASRVGAPDGAATTCVPATLQCCVVTAATVDGCTCYYGGSAQQTCDSLLESSDAGRPAASCPPPS